MRCDKRACAGGEGSALGDASPVAFTSFAYSDLRMIQTAYAAYADGRAHSEADQPVVPRPNEIVQSGMDHTGAQGGRIGSRAIDSLLRRRRKVTRPHSS